MSLSSNHTIVKPFFLLRAGGTTSDIVVSLTCTCIAFFGYKKSIVKGVNKVNIKANKPLTSKFLFYASGSCSEKVEAFCIED